MKNAFQRTQFLSLFLLFIFNACSSGPDDKKIEKNTKTPSIDTPGLHGLTGVIEKNPPVLQGDYIEKFDNGVVKMRGFYMNGKRDGQWISFFSNGKVRSEGFFKAGLRDGKALVYHENGEIYYEGYYTNGKETGKWIFYDMNGNKIKEKKYGK